MSDPRAPVLSAKRSALAAGRLAVRCRAMNQIWETLTYDLEPPAKRAREHYWFHQKFVENALLTSHVIGAETLLAGQKDSLRLQDVAQRLRNEGVDVEHAEASLWSVRDCVPKLTKLRNNAFAHLSRRQTYDDVFAEARISRFELRQACEAALTSANLLLQASGQTPLMYTSGVGDDAAAMFTRLAGSLATDPVLGMF